MSASCQAFFIKLALKLAPMCFLPFDGSLGAHLYASPGQENPVKLVLCPLEDVDEDGEVLAEATQCEHVVARIPLAVRD